MPTPKKKPSTAGATIPTTRRKRLTLDTAPEMQEKGVAAKASKAKTAAKPALAKTPKADAPKPVRAPRARKAPPASTPSETPVNHTHIGELDRYFLQEGTHSRSYEKLGAHIVAGGVHFAVWAPNAERVSVIGDFNQWNGDTHVMHPSEAGIWSLHVSGIGEGTLYKYEIRDAYGHLHQKADPYAFYAEPSPATASIVHPLPKAHRQGRNRQTIHDPISIYEVHLGSWRRGEDNRILTYRDLAGSLIPYVRDMGFTHIELMPVAEYPFTGSWGYQPTGLYAPTSRFGTPEDFCAFVSAAHEAGLHVLMDWVPGHFPNDAHGLALFDGTHLYEHADPREGKHQDWDTLIYNFGRREVGNFLISNALYWLDRFGIDGLRVDAVASMIYRNYSRKEGEWLPNIHGGVENLEATSFLRRMNELVYREYPDTVTIAEESTAWPGVSRPTYEGGLGFGFKWNMGWMHDTLKYMSQDPVHRKHHHHLMTFGMIYAYSENFVLPLSHDEVVHGKGSLIGRMPGDVWQRFANLRAYFGFMYGHPGKKLLFMGGEFAQWGEWQHDHSLDWHVLEEGDPHRDKHAGMQALVRDLNHLYRSTPALYRYDCEPQGFLWLDSDAAETSVYAFARFGEGEDDIAIIVSNFTPVVRHNYRVGVPKAGYYAERLNSDAAAYGGSNTGNEGGVHSEPVTHYGHAQSLHLTLPPLSTLIFTYRSGHDA